MRVHSQCQYSVVKEIAEQLFEAKARTSLMTSREGGAAGLSESDVKVAIARLQVEPSILQPNFCHRVIILQAAFDEERTQMKGQMLDLRSELDKAR